MVGPPPAVSNDEILDVLIKYDILEENGEVKPRRHEVWSLICREWNNRMKPVNLAYYVRQDRKNILASYLRIRGLAKDVVTDDTVTDSDSNYSKDTDIDGFNSNFHCRRPVKRRKQSKPAMLSFEIMLNDADWNNMKPTGTRCKNGRIYCTLQNGWANILVQKIWEQEKLPCVYIFKRALINMKLSLPFLIIRGQCKDCDAKLYGKCLKKPALNEGILITIKTLDTHKIPHTQKRSLKGLQCKRLNNILKHEKHKLYQQYLAKLEINNDGVEPAHN